MNRHSRLFEFIMRTTALTVVLCFSSACASSSKNISAAYVSPIQYDSYSCDQLRLEYVRINSKLLEVSGRQDSAATRDAIGMGVGLILFWPALFLLAGHKGNPEELARLKGECEAIEVCAIQKNCLLAQEIKEAKAKAQETAKKDVEAEKNSLPPGEVLK